MFYPRKINLIVFRRVRRQQSAAKIGIRFFINFNWVIFGSEESYKWSMIGLFFLCDCWRRLRSVTKRLLAERSARSPKRDHCNGLTGEAQEEAHRTDRGAGWRDWPSNAITLIAAITGLASWCLATLSQILLSCYSWPLSAIRPSLPFFNQSQR